MHPAKNAPPALSCAVLVLLAVLVSSAASEEFNIARLKYRGGGDWYSDPTSMPNLLARVKRDLGIETARDEVKLDIRDESLFNHPFAYMTGHGKVKFSDEEAARHL